MKGWGMDAEIFDIADVRRIIPRRIDDERGHFAETLRADTFTRDFGAFSFVQDNESFSARPFTVRGLHFQIAPQAQGKLLRCTAGQVFDVAVDIRRGSPTYGRWIGETLTSQNGVQVWLPPGFAHGFCTLTPDTVISYKVTAYYDAARDKGLAWDDPLIAIDWPDIADPNTLSPKDRRQPTLADLPEYFAWQE